MYLLILYFPLIASIYSGIFGFFFGRQGVCLLVCIFSALNFLLALFIFYEVCLSNAFVSLKLYTWINISPYDITLGLYFDTLTALMLLIITFISFVVHVYSVDYMSHDPYQSRFMCYLSLFTFFMLILVTADNYLQLFMGWEGVGLCSYLLINFWFTRVLANKAALKAMIMNRIADVFFIFAILILILLLKTTDYLIVFSSLSFLKEELIIFLGFPCSALNLIATFLFLGAIGKSAQLGFHTWLPDAMEGPTPVSSLLHAATMVTAGVFLLLRSSPLLDQAPNVLWITALIGGLTAFFFALVGIFQYDLKKVIAYSTCSQLGYMFLACGLSNYNLAAFHLFNHAFFKALLFLGAGAVIHAFYDEQDMRRMGQAISFLPFIYLCFFIGSLAILGIPFLTGFYSKDLLLELTYTRYTVDALFIYFLAVSTALFTAIYSIRLLLMVFFTSSLKETTSYRIFTLKEVPPYMHFSLFLLAICSIFVGYLFSEIFSGIASPFWHNSLVPSSVSNITLDQEFLSPWVKLLPVYLSLIGGVAVFLFYEYIQIIFHGILHNKHKMDKPIKTGVLFFGLKKISSVTGGFFFNAGYFNQFYNDLFIKYYKYSYDFHSKTIDKGFLEFFGPYGLYLAFRKTSINLKNLPSSLFFNTFLMFFMITIFILISYLYWTLIIKDLYVIILPLMAYLIILLKEQ